MRVVIGRIGKAHGIRGEVTVEIRTDEPEIRFVEGARLFCDETTRVLVIETVRPHGGGLLIGFEGIADRTVAEALRGILLEAERDRNDQPADSDEFYDVDLVGLEVRDEAGVTLGVVDEVVHLPSQDLLSIRGVDDRMWLLPFVAELVPSVDIGAGVIIAAPPPGLMETQEVADSDTDGLRKA